VASLAAACAALGAAGGAASAAVVLRPLVSAASPVYVTHVGDRRLFIVELAGRIQIYDPTVGGLRATPFLDVRSKVSTGSERGFFSVAFHPDYASNGFFYVDYTNLNGDTMIERYRVTADPNVADPSSAATLLLISQPFSNHNGGQLQIGPRDGYLYIGMGDGGSEGDPSCFGQRRDTMLGKMLRLDVRANPSQPPFYGIPPDNPFIGAADPQNLEADEIWASGLRNPWRFSFDRTTGDLYIGDVGENNFEEVDLHPATAPGGQNYGWKVMEGFHCSISTDGCPADTLPCNSPGLTLPIHEYNHDTGDCAITGGYFYRGTRVPELAGRYVFGDYCSGDIRGLVQTAPGNWQSQPLAQASFGLTSFGQGVDGELYATVGNQVFALVSDAAPPIVPAAGPRWLAALGAGLAAAGAGAIGARARRARRHAMDGAS
jgi:glucose/arabinose dehydrogenase